MNCVGNFESSSQMKLLTKPLTSNGPVLKLSLSSSSDNIAGHLKLLLNLNESVCLEYL